MKVLFSKYGDIGECLEHFGAHQQPTSWSSWWRDLLREISSHDWFHSHVKLRVGDGKRTRFWEDVWTMNGVKLKEVYPRLYRLSTFKSIKVSDVVQVVEDGFHFTWSWVRSLLDRELTQVGLLENLVRQECRDNSQSDQWIWTADSSDRKSVV